MDLSNIPARDSYDWHRIPARKIDRWTVAADLGQSSDPTAICIMHHRRIPLDEWAPNLRAKHWKQRFTEHFDVRHLERLPLGTPYPQVVQHCANLLARPPLNSLSPKFVVDETGVGRAVCDQFDVAGLYPQRVTITAGHEVTQHGGRSWHVPKGVLVSGVDSRLNTGELGFAASLRDAEALRDELQNFQRSVTAAGRATYAARTGQHDDLVLAVAIALWWTTNYPEVTRSEWLL